MASQAKGGSVSEPISLPSKRISGSALQPVSNQLYRYVGKDRSVDQTSTKSWRRRMRQLQFQIFRTEPWSYEGFDFKPAQNGYVTVLGSDGQYHYLPERDLNPEGCKIQSLADGSAAAELWAEEVRA